MRDFGRFLDSLPFSELPSRRIDAVVLVSEREDAWPVLQHAWLLSRQAGFDIQYASAECLLPESKFYILPSGTDLDTYSRSAWQRVCEKAEQGATVLVTLGNRSMLSQLREMTGVENLNFFQQSRVISFSVDGKKIEFSEPATRKIAAHEAKVLIADESGEPLMTEFALGKGKVLFFNAAVEANGGLESWPVYALAARIAGVNRRVSCDNSQIGLTEHPLSDGRTVVVAVNYMGERVRAAVRTDGRIGCVWNGAFADGWLAIAAHDGCVFEINQKETTK